MVADTVVKSRIDSTSAGQESILDPPKGAAGIRTSKNSQEIEQAKKLKDLVVYSERRLDHHRTKRLEMIRHFAGPHYGSNWEMAEPLGLIYSLVSTLVPALLIRPRAMVTATDEDMMAFAETFRLRIDDEIKALKLDRTLKRVVVDALFATGVTKCGLRATGAGFDTSGNIADDPGAIYCDVVDFDDYIVDMTAKRRSEAAIEGNRYLVDYQDAMDSGRFERDELERYHEAKVAAAEASKARSIDGPASNEREEYELYDRLELIDLYVPKESAIITIPGDPVFEIGGYLAEAGWTGPAAGPYDTYGFTPVPGNMLPLPVCSVVYDLFLLINRVARKIGRQAERQKDLGLFSKGEEDSAEVIRDASDGEMVGVRDVDAVKAFSIGGVNENGYRAVAWLQDWMNRLAGNTDIIGGLNADANTLGQDQLNVANAGVRVNDWRGEVTAAADSTLEKIAAYIWSDPVTVRELRLEVAEGLSVPRTWHPDSKVGGFEEYTLSVDPYHFRDKGPEEMYRLTRQWIMDLSQPGLVQAAAAQGMALDVEKVAEVLGRNLGIDERDAMFKPIARIGSEGIRGSGGGGGGQGDTVNNYNMSGSRRTGTFGGQRPTAENRTQEPNDGAGKENQ